MTLIFELQWHMKYQVFDWMDFGEVFWMYETMSERIKQENQNQQEAMNNMGTGNGGRQ